MKTHKKKISGENTCPFITTLTRRHATHKDARARAVWVRVRFRSCFRSSQNETRVVVVGRSGAREQKSRERSRRRKEEEKDKVARKTKKRKRRRPPLPPSAGVSIARPRKRPVPFESRAVKRSGVGRRRGAIDARSRRGRRGRFNESGTFFFVSE